ncbi:MAG: HTTM domain-containing protein [Kofleriaceae bacterium]
MREGSTWHRVRTAAGAPVDVASLAAFRVLFGLVMLAAVVRMLTSGWIERLYEQPTFHFTYPGFGWVEAWPAPGMYLHYAVLAVLAAMITVGAWTRLAAAAFALGFAYPQLVDVTNYLNHNVLAVLLAALLAVVPAGAAWSVDAWRRPSVRRRTMPAWCLWLIRFQVGVVYVGAGLAKMKVDWLGAGQPLGLWLAARTETPVVGPWLDEPALALAMSWAACLFDTTIVAWLAWRRTRVGAYLVLVGFHAVTGYFFNIGMFPLIMTAAATIFFAPSWPRRWIRAETPAGDAPPVRASRLLATVLVVHVGLQLVLPLRHLVYPGDVLWNEDGMRLAWHVMIREKHGSVVFVARWPDGRRLEVAPHRYLDWRQEKEMAGQPDLILQLARHVGAELRAAGHADVAVHAETRVSLNGRAAVPLIDPAVDLLTVSDLGPRTGWVLPAPTGPAPRLRPRR